MSLKKLLSAKMTRKMEMVNEVDDLKNTESTTWGKFRDLEKKSRYFRKNILYEALPWWDETK